MKLSLVLYAVMLFTSAVAAFLGTDEAAKYINAETLFYLRGGNAIVNGVATGLKAFTSQIFSDWMALKKAGIKTGDTEFLKNTGP
jgi:hypothetical protein